MDTTERIAALRELVFNWQAARQWAAFNEKAALDRAPSEEAGEFCKVWLEHDQKARDMLPQLITATGELWGVLGQSAPRSLIEFGVHLEPQHDQDKALALWPTVLADLLLVEPGEPAGETVTIYKSDLEAALNISRTEMNRRIDAGKIEVIDRAGSKKSRTLRVPLGQFSNDQQRRIRGKADPS